MDTQEFLRIKFLFEISNRVVDAVGFAFGDGVGELVLRVEVRDAREIDEPQTLAQA